MAIDNELLSDYAFEGLESAFGDLVRRHIDLVYFAAVREVAGNARLAEEVTQTVFLELARKAFAFYGHPALAGWLYTHVRRSVAGLRRLQPRSEHTQAINKQLRPGLDPSPWPEIGRVLDDAMHELGERDKVTVVLRFFEQRTIEEVGTVLGLSGSATHARIDRALEQLRKLLRRRGVTSTTSGLAAAFSVGATLSAPLGLAARVTASVLAMTASGVSGGPQQNGAQQNPARNQRDRGSRARSKIKFVEKDARRIEF